MSAIIVVGAQWGDEGKGRVVDWLARDARLVARFNGGDNAGHTVVAQGRTLKLHLVPSGVLHPDLVCLIGAGVVVNPERLVTELDELAGLGIDVGPARLKLSAATHVILPTHRALDGAGDAARGKASLGTTKRGIGPTYADKAARTGLRAGDMANPEQFAERVAELSERQVLFFACSTAIQRLRDKGVEVRVLPQANVEYSALDRVVLRLQEGWAYQKI